MLNPDSKEIALRRLIAGFAFALLVAALPGVRPARAQKPEPATAMLKPSAYKAGTPERAVAEFLVGWKNRDWARMERFTQKTFAREARNYPKAYGATPLIGARITEITRTDPTTARVQIVVTYWATYRTGSTGTTKHESERLTRTISPSVVREAAPHKPSLAGQWGVDPVSMTRQY